MKYEDLVRILVEEKKSSISRIPPDFYSQINDYIKELEEVERKISRRHSEEAVMIQYELKNALSAVEKIFNKRTGKIIKMASSKAFSKKPTNISHDIDYMTPEERDIYHQMLNTILQGKKNIIEPILGNDNDVEIQENIEPEPASSIITDYENQDQAVVENELTVEVLSPDTHFTEDTNRSHEDMSTSLKTPIETATSDEHGKKDLNKEYIVVRILKDISTFAGSDGRNYTLNAHDVAVLPKVNAKALLKRKMAIEIKST